MGKVVAFLSGLHGILASRKAFLGICFALHFCVVSFSVDTRCI